MSIRDMAMKEQCEIVHERMIEKGFWSHAIIEQPNGAGVENPSIWGEKLDLIHSELAEVTEARRNGDVVGEAGECADVLIRLMDYCGARKFDLGREYVKKMEKNYNRPYLHGRKF